MIDNSFEDTNDYHLPHNQVHKICSYLQKLDNFNYGYEMVISYEDLELFKKIPESNLLTRCWS